MKTAEECLSYLKDRLYYPATGLLYDSVISADTPLPSPAEIAADLPTANGNGTVMEDCMISGGTCLHGLCARLERGDASAAAFAEKIADGMLKNAESGTGGYVPRGVHPLDGRLHYRDCSRDQITMFLYGLLRYASTAFCPEGTKTRIRNASAALAERAIRFVTEANGWDLLTEDGKPSVNAVLWGPERLPHECFRLPQLWLTAFVLTGEPRYDARYLSVRGEGLARSLPVNDCWALYGLQQMAVSVDTAYRFDPDPAVRGRCAGILNAIADAAAARVPEIRSRIQSASEEDYRKRGGYYIFYRLQDAAIVPMLEAMAPDREVGAEGLALCAEVLDRIPFEGTTALPVHFFTALELAQNKRFPERSV